ncbi:MAG: glycosyltransferase family 4 protein [Bacteroidia bacterium]|jgi:glycosyltransferase involved in cell wall biosynthesis|nr:glycosyltransferase family 4 protein [Bacteroidia bacterium]
MKIIILTQYYPPETGAPQNRLHSLAKYFIRSGHEVTVATAMPNYLKSEIFDGYKGKWYLKEELDGVTVIRSAIFTSKKQAFIYRFLNYISFVFTSFFLLLLKGPKADYLICESPPLFLGITAVFISKIKGYKLAFNISDIWPETIVKIGALKNKTIIRILEILEHWIYRNSFIIVGQTEGIVQTIESKYPKKNVYCLRNGIDFSAFNFNDTDDLRAELNIDSSQFVFMYTGLFGLGIGVDIIVHAASKLPNLPITFILAGDGPEKEKVLSAIETLQVNNVMYLGHLPRQKMTKVINTADAAIIPVKKIDLDGIIPSKTFEALAFKKPILLGVDGEARKIFIDRGKAGLFFEPENADALASCILELYNNRDKCKVMGENGRAFVEQHYDREIIATSFINYLASLNK